MIRTINAVKASHWTTKSFIAMLLVSWMSLLYIGWLVFWPFKTMETKNLPYPILNSPVEAGQIVVWEVDSCRYTDIAADVTRTLVGEVTIQLNSEYQTLAKGCSVYRVATTIIPSYTPEGKYHIEIAATYRINPIRQIDRHFRTQEFEVIRPPKDEDGNEVVSPPRVIRLQGENLTPSGSGSQTTLQNTEPINEPDDQTPPPPSLTEQVIDCIRRPIACIDRQP